MRPGRLTAGEGGQALAEIAIAFPLQVALTLGILQAGHLSMGHAFTRYAAFAAARAALPEPDREAWAPSEKGTRKPPDPVRAAQVALLPVVGTSLAAPIPRGMLGFPPVGRIPGARLLDLARQAAVREKTRVTVRRERARVSARVEHDFELVVPWVGGWFARWRGAPRPSGYGGVPHVTLTAECVLPR